MAEERPIGWWVRRLDALLEEAVDAGHRGRGACPAGTGRCCDSLATGHRARPTAGGRTSTLVVSDAGAVAGEAEVEGVLLALRVLLGTTAAADRVQQHLPAVGGQRDQLAVDRSRRRTSTERATGLAERIVAE